MTSNEPKTKYTFDGLSETEASIRLKKFGPNTITEQKKENIVVVFLRQFADLLVIILIISAIISFVSGNVESTIVIFAVLIFNAILGTIQHVKAEKSLDALKSMAVPKAKVMRGGIKKEISSKDIVPGDLLLPEAGDMIAADGRIIDNFMLKVNESSLTGESEAVEKTDADIDENAALGDRLNMVYSGSLVTYGHARVVVTATGMDTEIGKIAKLMDNTGRNATPLQKSLDIFGRKLAFIIIIISIIVFILRIIQGDGILASLMFAVALAVAAIPEALGSIVTIVQAMGTEKMAADNAVIKELSAVEGLGCVSVICSDKTGTLTQNKMKVERIYLGGKCLPVYAINGACHLHKYFLYNCILNNDADIQDENIVGDPTETCLLSMAENAGISNFNMTISDIRTGMPRLGEIPFDSNRKLMSSKYMIDGKTVMFTKGAADILLERVNYMETEDGILPITDKDREDIYKQNIEFSRQGLRVLALVYKECAPEGSLDVNDEYDYIFLGLAAMMDPPREEAKQAVSDCVDAGIRPIMITGDHKVTAAAIANQIGILRQGDITVTGPELDNMSDTELDEALTKISVYARVSPENKIRIVDAWQKKGSIVAMTGDGVNDAPALKKANIGISMGRIGTEVAKDASDMILTDDNFATIVKAVLNGRNVYRNIMNALIFLLSGNLAAILVVLYCTIMGLATPFEPIHLLFINLVTDSLPAIAIGMEPSDPNLLKDKPRNKDAGIFNRSFSTKLIFYGILIGISVLTAFYTGLKTDAALAGTMAFATLTLARLFHGFSCRNHSSLIKAGIKSNMWSVGAFFIGAALLAFILLAPFMHRMFMVESLTCFHLSVVLLLSFLPTFIIQSIRFVREVFFH